MEGHNLALFKIFGTVATRLQFKCFKLVLLPKEAHLIYRHPKHTSWGGGDRPDSKAGLPHVEQMPALAAGENKRRWETAGRGEAFLLGVVLNENT